ncbi:ArgS-related anticodon-binding protein NrtL [Streptomyces sp. NPDC006476]|uniref:ArgS-related anticodon-binding protein NrtL n=1 Tax=Streptomyces sp. NPDC006476 TaxID=3157175 RepID=UPI0033AD8034
MTPVELSRTVLGAVRRAVDGGELRVAVPARAVVTPPGPGGCGDYATNIALQLARAAGQPPLRVAEILCRYLVETDGVAGVTVTGPGFINISLEGAAPVVLVRDILRVGTAYGHSDALAGRIVELRIPYEVRAEVVADALTRIIASQGGRAEVEHAEPINLRPVRAPEDPAPLGPDAARWAMLHPAPHDRPRITADHLVQRESNPLFRVRYAHARTRALTRNAAALGFTAEPGEPGDVRLSDHGESSGGEFAPVLPSARGDLPSGRTEAEGLGRPVAGGLASAAPSAPSAPSAPGAPRGAGPSVADEASASEPEQAGSAPALATRLSAGPATRTPLTFTPLLIPLPDPAPLLTALADHPRVLLVAATSHAPDRLARHLVSVADALLPLLPAVLPRGAEKPSAAHRARLALAEAAGAVLAGGLSLLGIDAPQHL